MSFADDNLSGNIFHYDPDEHAIFGSARLELIVDLNNQFFAGWVKYYIYANIKMYLQQYNPFFFAAAGRYIHAWTVEGRIEFRHANSQTGNPVIFRTGFGQALLTSWSPFGDRTGCSFTVQNNEYAEGMFFDSSSILQAVGVNDMTFRECFGFTITNIEPYMPIQILNDGRITEPWKGDGSFSASGGF